MAFCFGIYPGGMHVSEKGIMSGKPDQPMEIEKALSALQGNAPEFLVRSYVGYQSGGIHSTMSPMDTWRYSTPSRKLDLVLCFQSEEEDMTGWKKLIRDVIVEHGHQLAKIQITEEANVSLRPLDGYYRHSRKALVEGVIEAKRQIRKLGFDIQVGFNATPDFNHQKGFWKEIALLAREEFYEALDYIGLDFFPDVFRPLPAGADLSQAIKGVLTMFRHSDMKDAGIVSNIPIHITENGWPTNTIRTEAQQAVTLEKIIRTIHGFRDEFNITHYELFDLRDADSTLEDIFYRFGIMHDDYTPKKAFAIFQQLIAALTQVK